MLHRCRQHKVISTALTVLEEDNNGQGFSSGDKAIPQDIRIYAGAVKRESLTLAGYEIEAGSISVAGQACTRLH